MNCLICQKPLTYVVAFSGRHNATNKLFKYYFCSAGTGRTHYRCKVSNIDQEILYEYINDNQNISEFKIDSLGNGKTLFYKFSLSLAPIAIINGRRVINEYWNEIILNIGILA